MLSLPAQPRPNNAVDPAAPVRFCSFFDAPNAHDQRPAATPLNLKTPSRFVARVRWIELLGQFVVEMLGVRSSPQPTTLCAHAPRTTQVLHGLAAKPRSDGCEDRLR